MQKELTHPIDIRTITEKGINVAFEATPEELKALAKRFDVPEIKSLKTKLILAGTDLINVSGKFTAVVLLEDVVSLEKFQTTISEGFEVLFTKAKKPKTKKDSIEIDLSLDEEAEPISGNTIDCGDVVSEQFGLALPAFPKKTDTYFVYEEPLSEAEETAKNPFSILKKLKKK